MKSLEIRAKLNSAIEKVQKAEATIAKREATIEKKTAQLKKMGFNSTEEADAWIRAEDLKLERDEFGCAYRTPEQMKVIDVAWGIERAISDNEDTARKVKELQKKVESWQTRLDNQLEIEKKFVREVPEAFKQAMEDLINRWTEWDIEARNEMRKMRAEGDWKEFRKAYPYSVEIDLDKTDDQLRKANERDAMAWVLDLYYRTFNITGEVTDCNYLYFNGKALNGKVIGKKGTARVETIVAGGWNIQRLHYRVLVHQM